MGSPLEARLYEILTLDNLIWLLAFIAGCITIYWRLRNYLAGRTKEYMTEIAAETAKNIIDQVTKDNIVTELNMKELIDQKIAKVNECNKRIEDQVAQNGHKFEIHLARAEERDKALDRVITIVDKSLTLVNTVSVNGNKSNHPVESAESDQR